MGMWYIYILKIFIYLLVYLSVSLFICSWAFHSSKRVSWIFHMDFMNSTIICLTMTVIYMSLGWWIQWILWKIRMSKMPQMSCPPKKYACIPHIYIYIHVFTSYKSIQTYKPQIPKKDKPKAPSCLASKSPLAPPTCTADLLTHLNGSRDDDLEEHPRWSGCAAYLLFRVPEWGTR